MKNIIATIRKKIPKMQKTSETGKIKTKDVRILSAYLFRELEDTSLQNVFTICEERLREKDPIMQIVAYDFAYRVRKQYDNNTFQVFEGWLKKYIRNWGDCDDFCTHAFSEVIMQNPQLTNKIVKWVNHHEFAVRRATAVILIPLIRKSRYKDINPLGIADLLMQDEHYLVQKGYGWMLKEYGKKEPKIVFEYLKKNVSMMPRVAFRYAMEHWPDNMKKELMTKGQIELCRQT